MEVSCHGRIRRRRSWHDIETYVGNLGTCAALLRYIVVPA